MTNAILSVEDLSVVIHGERGPARILDRAWLRVGKGEIVGLVGESGCGKSTMVRAILGVLPQDGRAESGRILFQGQDLLKLDERTLTQTIRSRRISFIPQDPALAFNPNFTVGEQLLEIWRWHGPEGNRGKAAGRARLVDLLRQVQLPDPAAALDRYPHQFSGGQRQRLQIAGALLCNPELIIADEPTTALDVTTQQQILILLAKLVQNYGISVLFVTHDFGVVSQLCTHVTVMYAGQTAEIGTKTDLLRDPAHPYTRALLDCHPDRMSELNGIPGAVASPLAPPPGCRYHPRCSQAVTACSSRTPALRTGSDGRQVNCMLRDSVSPVPPFNPSGRSPHGA